MTQQIALLSLSWTLLSLLYMLTLNALPIDELGNWCQPRLVGALCKYQAQQGGSYREPLPNRDRKGWVQNWQNRRPKQ